MTTTPTIWLGGNTVTSATGVQSDPMSVELADGRIFTLWVDDTNNVDTAAGTDIIGRQLDYYQGFAAPFHVNTNIFTGAEDQPEVVALPDGGVFAVYHSTASGNDVYYVRFDAAGGVVSSGSIATGSNNYNRPSITLLGNNTIAVGYTSEGTSENYGVAIYDLATNTIGARPTFDDPVGPNTGGTSIEVAALGSDSYVAIYAAELLAITPPFDILELRGVIYGPSGQVASFTIPDTENASSLQVSAVLGGGFVVAYDPNLDSDFYARVYTATGSQVGSTINLGLPTGQFSTILYDVVGLKEGGFFVLYESGTTSLLQGQRYSDTGAKIGNPITLSGSGVDDGELALTQDGRIIVTREEFGNIIVTILDPRDEGLAIVGDETDQILSARTEGSWVLGGGGRDILLGSSGPDTLDGGNDADILKGGGGNDRLIGGAAQDTAEGGGGNDTYVVGLPGVTIGGGEAILDIFIEQAGAGIDTVEVEFHDIPIGGGFAFFFDTYTLPDNIENGVILGTDSFVLIGNGLDNSLQGNGAVNFLYGGTANDTLSGLGGADWLFGEAGNDTFYVDNFYDKVFETSGQGFDVIFTSSSYTLAGSQSIEELRAANQSSTLPINLSGNGFSQLLSGNNGSNSLNGNGGADKMYGRGGDDTFIVDDAGDATYETTGQGTDSVFVKVSFTLTAGQSIETLATTSQAGTDAINLTGNNLNQTVNGNSGANVLNGGGGTDTLFGRSGNDAFVFDTALGASNIDTIGDYSVVADTIRLSQAIFTGIGATLDANEFVIGSAALDANDRIIYNSTTGALIFDSNGSTAGGAQQFATLSTGLAMTASEFLMIA